MNRTAGQLIGAALLTAGCAGLLLAVLLGISGFRLVRGQADVTALQVAAARIESLHSNLSTLDALMRHIEERPREPGDATPLLARNMLDPVWDEAQRLSNDVPTSHRSDALRVQEQIVKGPLTWARESLASTGAGTASAASIYSSAAGEPQRELSALVELRELRLALQRDGTALADATRADADRFELLATLSAILFMVLIAAVWWWLYAHLAQPLRQLSARAAATATDGAPFEPQATGVVEAQGLADAIGGLCRRLTQNYAELTEARRRLEREEAVRLDELRGRLTASEHLHGDTKGQLRRFENLAARLATIQSREEILAEGLRGLCALIDARGAAARTVDGVLGHVDFEYLDPNLPADRASHLRNRLIAGAESEPTAPTMFGGGASDLQDLPILDSRQQEIGRLHVLTGNPSNDDAPRHSTEQEIEHCKAVASIMGACIERAGIREVYDRQLVMMVHMRDPDESPEHVERLAELSVAILQRLSHSRRQVKFMDDTTEEITPDELRHAARLHDVGKVAVSDLILRKGGPLSLAERGVLQCHAEHGAHILMAGASTVAPSVQRGGRARDTGLARIDMIAVDVALHHHQRWDGTGYPAVAQQDGTMRPLKGEEIPLAARIVAVADVADALVSKRVYKEPWPIEEALAEVERGSGTHFDPHIVRSFLASIGDPRVRGLLERVE